MGIWASFRIRTREIQVTFISFPFLFKLSDWLSCCAPHERVVFNSSPHIFGGRSLDISSSGEGVIASSQAVKLKTSIRNSAFSSRKFLSLLRKKPFQSFRIGFRIRIWLNIFFSNFKTQPEGLKLTPSLIKVRTCPQDYFNDKLLPWKRTLGFFPYLVKTDSLSVNRLQTWCVWLQ